jgi:hypothetical protein
VLLQSNLVKQLGKLVKVRYVEDITKSKRVGEWQDLSDVTSCSQSERLRGWMLNDYEPHMIDYNMW